MSPSHRRLCRCFDRDYSWDIAVVEKSETVKAVGEVKSPLTRPGRFQIRSPKFGVLLHSSLGSARRGHLHVLRAHLRFHP